MKGVQVKLMMDQVIIRQSHLSPQSGNAGFSYHYCMWKLSDIKSINKFLCGTRNTEKNRTPFNLIYYMEPLITLLLVA
jgi:hypothetical protein